MTVASTEDSSMITNIPEEIWVVNKDSKMADTDDSTGDSTPRKRPSVRFSFVEVQEYPVTLGEHDCTPDFPMTLDWSHTNSQEFDLLPYESLRYEKSPRRLWLSSSERQLRISETSGASRQDILLERESRREEQAWEEIKNRRKTSSKRQRKTVPIVWAMIRKSAKKAFH
jgi:hypothetical protein